MMVKAGFGNKLARWHVSTPLRGQRNVSKWTGGSGYERMETDRTLSGQPLLMHGMPPSEPAGVHGQLHALRMWKHCTHVCTQHGMHIPMHAIPLQCDTA